MNMNILICVKRSCIYMRTRINGEEKIQRKCDEILYHRYVVPQIIFMAFRLPYIYIWVFLLNATCVKFVRKIIISVCVRDDKCLVSYTF